MTVSRDRFTHDCDRCKFLGQDEEHDFYFCPSPSGMHTVIARYGSEGPEYLSGLEIARLVRAQLDFEYPLSKALTLAEDQGLLVRPEAVVPDSEDPSRIVLYLDSAILNAKLAPRIRLSEESRKSMQEALLARLMKEFLYTKCTPQTLEVMRACLLNWLKELDQHGKIAEAWLPTTWSQLEKQ